LFSAGKHATIIPQVARPLMFEAMTHVSFDTPVGILLNIHSFATTTVPRVGEEIFLRTADGYKTFKVERVTWYEAREPYEGLEAEVELSLCVEGGR
jgi:hypothetical protein